MFKEEWISCSIDLLKDLNKVPVSYSTAYNFPRLKVRLRIVFSISVHKGRKYSDLFFYQLQCFLSLSLCALLNVLADDSLFTWQEYIYMHFEPHRSYVSRVLLVSRSSLMLYSSQLLWYFFTLALLNGVGISYFLVQMWKNLYQISHLVK